MLGIISYVKIINRNSKIHKDMEINIISTLKDNRVNCLSVMVEMKVSDYLEKIDVENKISGQRDVLKTSSAVAIRKRLIEDVKNGAVIPPIVLGLIIDDSIGEISFNSNEIEELINKNIGGENLSIIDGMQRTESLRQAVSTNPNINNQNFRVEFWIANNVSSLIYRMLVLNTGQVPWTVRRQIEIIHKPLIKEVVKNVPGIKLSEIDDNTRRTNAGEYQANSIIELYMVYGARKEFVDTKEKLADDFNRLDIINMSGDNEYTKNFFRAIHLLFDFDIAISKYQGNEEFSSKFKSGKDLFTSMPAKVGFIVSIARAVVGRPGGTERNHSEQEQRMINLTSQMSSLIQKINLKEGAELDEFMSFVTLNEKIQSLPTQRIGDAERDFFVKAFSSLVESKFEVTTLNEAWMAY